MLVFINAILGSALLVLGRKLFWLFIGVAGFVTGIQFTNRIFHGPEVQAIIWGLVIGLIFAGLAIFAQTLAIGIAGFLTGGYVLLALTSIVGLDRGPLAWVIYIVGGIIGILLVTLLFDWAVITLSSMAGAALVVQAFSLQRVAGGLLFILLFFAGVIIQGMTLRYERSRTQQNPNS